LPLKRASEPNTRARSVWLFDKKGGV
jgi:hypothetical protein